MKTGLQEASTIMWLLLFAPSSSAFQQLLRPSVKRAIFSGQQQALFSSSASSSTFQAVENGISRLSTLQELLSKHGAPGSEGCKDKAGDLAPVVTSMDTPELLASLGETEDELRNLHPHLFPISRSKTSGNFVCALRTASSGDSAPWPIVEAALCGPGYRLLALNSEHLMRRIACENDFSSSSEDDDDSSEEESLVPLYNDGLGKGLLNDAALDSPYQPGDVAKLGYGVEKYTLLRVGPFPDLYQQMALGHKSRGDEPSSLIAAEASNGKFGGFASPYRFYARLLASLPKRDEEARDAARMCLRLPLPSIGLSSDDFREVAVLGKIAGEADTDGDVMEKLRNMYEKIKDSEKEDSMSDKGGMTPEQTAIEEANYLLDTTALSGGKWSEIRGKLATIYNAAGLGDMAAFVDSQEFQ